MPGLKLTTCITFLLCLQAGSAFAEGRPLQFLLQQLAGETEVDVSGIRISNNRLLQALYAGRDFRRAWDATAREKLAALIAAATESGLDPRDYPLPQVDPAQAGVSADALDLLYSWNLIRLAAHHFHGRLDHQTLLADDELDTEELGADPLRLIEDAISSADFPRLMSRLSPRTPDFERLLEAYGDHRAIAAAGGWPLVPDGPSLHPGERSARTPVLRHRLRLSSDLRDEDAHTDPQVYDRALERAVRHFQVRHQLLEDGIVGKQTLAALNVPLERRIEQIRLNLERARWLLHRLPPRYLLVDIAGFELRLVEEGRTVLYSRAVVGKPYRRTPVFQASIRSIVVHPSWTVPPNILKHDVLPQIRKDLAYLERRHMNVIDAAGDRVDPSGIDWSRYRGADFPYQIRQEPGPHNALGAVKFVFPNPFMVYLHDTPEPELYSRPERAFSSGCIRAQKARELAQRLLGSDGWTPAAIEQLFADPRTQRIELRQTLPILIFYWTVAIEDDGDVLFKRDIYGRDAELQAALERR